MSTRRRLDVGADGMANVLLLTNPIPRHVSLVSWGANDRPTTAWKNAQPPALLLRSPPSDQMIDVSTVSQAKIQGFVAETIDAWNVTVNDVLSTPLSSAERSSRIQGLSVQAGARVAAMAVALSPKVVSRAMHTYKSVGLKLPDPPAATTLQGELDRRHFLAAFNETAAAITDKVMTVFQEGSETMTETILLSFGEAGRAMAQWAGSLPAGVVGVQATERAGARNSKTDSASLQKVKELVDQLIGAPPQSEKSMSVTIADIQRLASEDPKGFLAIIKTALGAADDGDLSDTRKVFWGETGEEPLDPDAIINSLRNMQGGDAIASLIASAVGGVDIGVQAESDNTQVAATMRDGFAKFITAELRQRPEGELATAVKEAVAPSVAEALKMIIGGGGTSIAGITDPSLGNAFGFSSEELEEMDPWTAEMPGSKAG